MGAMKDRVTTLAIEAGYDPCESEGIAYAIGFEHGEELGSSVFDGNTDRATFERVLAGIDDGDPEIMDMYPGSPLSGEWADDYSVRDLTYDLGMSSDTYHDPDDLARESIYSWCDAYEQGHMDGYWREVERTARYHTEG